MSSKIQNLKPSLHAPLLVLTALAILYYPVFRSLVHEWATDPDFSHGFIVPFVSLYLVWKNREELESCKPVPKNSGLALIIISLFLFFVGKLAAENFLMRISFIGVLSGIILFTYGKDHLKAVSFPIIYLIFMIPIPSIIINNMTFHMQLVASRIATFFIQLMGIPVLLEGNIINLSGFSLEVAKACSGIRSLISLLAFGTIIAYFTKKTFFQRLLMVLSCFPIAIIVNAFRVAMTAYLSVHYGPEAAMGFLHEFAGIIMFAIAMVLFVLTGVIVSKFFGLIGRLFPLCTP